MTSIWWSHLTSTPRSITDIPYDQILTSTCWERFCHSTKMARTESKDAVIFGALIQDHRIEKAILFSVQLGINYRPALIDDAGGFCAHSQHVHPKHPPDEEYRDDGSRDVNYPVARCFRFPKIKHGSRPRPGGDSSSDRRVWTLVISPWPVLLAEPDSRQGPERFHAGSDQPCFALTVFMSTAYAVLPSTLPARLALSNPALVRRVRYCSVLRVPSRESLSSFQNSSRSKRR